LNYHLHLTGELVVYAQFYRLTRGKFILCNFGGLATVAD